MEAANQTRTGISAIQARTIDINVENVCYSLGLPSILSEFFEDIWIIWKNRLYKCTGGFNLLQKSSGFWRCHKNFLENKDELDNDSSGNNGCLATLQKLQSVIPFHMQKYRDILLQCMNDSIVVKLVELFCN